ncbi:MAG: hypothetical protein CXT78_09225, partial [Thaumarchaeota archaeon]
MKKFRDFESAREFVRKLKLKNTTEWQEYCKSGNKPDDIPSSPNTTYKKDFKGYGDWLGTGTVHTKQWRSFTDAREFARALNLKGNQEWREYCKSGNKPDDIPANPNTTYKKDFKGFGDWLGTGTVAPKLNLKGYKEWITYCKSGNKPDDVPANPYQTYKKDFKGMGDWLGTGTVARKNKVFRSFEPAREFARALNLKSNSEWREYCKSGEKPDDIPAAANEIYKKDFKGYGDWLGTGTVAPQDRA